ncbi:MAG TPA: hypothetical protein VHQ86_00325, partial [Candidatus Saccharimonadia bacterium]|nr:hypothetical protein [Candidatus Saccharimonadia bacterium]
MAFQGYNRKVVRKAISKGFTRPAEIETTEKDEITLEKTTQHSGTQTTGNTTVSQPGPVAVQAGIDQAEPFDRDPANAGDSAESGLHGADGDVTGGPDMPGGGGGDDHEGGPEAEAEGEDEGGEEEAPGEGEHHGADGRDGDGHEAEGGAAAAGAAGAAGAAEGEGGEGAEGADGDGKHERVGDGLTSGTNKPTLGDAAHTAARRAAMGTALEMGKEMGKEALHHAAKDAAIQAAGKAAGKQLGKKAVKEIAKDAAKKATKKAIKKTAKRTLFKWIFGIGLPTGGMMGFFFLLLLFQSVHIRHVFMDYEFAKFNRAFTNRLKEAAARAKTVAKGTADTTVDAAADPETQVEEANKEAIDELTSDDTLLDNAVEDAMQYEQTDSPTAPGGELDTEYEIARGLPDVANDINPSEKPGATGEKPVTDASTELLNEIEGTGGTPAGVTVPDELKDGVEDVQAAEQAYKDGKAPRPTADTFKAISVKDVTAKISGVTGAAAAPLFILTMACIARDIYVSSVKLFAEIKLSALARFAAAYSKTSGCRQEGKCGLAYEAAVDTAFSSLNDSYTNSAGYHR